MRIDITAHPAEDIVMDLAGVRELQAENARLSTDRETIQTHIRELQAQLAEARLNTDRETMQTHIRELQEQLAEARKQPVRVLPEITQEIASEMVAEYCLSSYTVRDRGKAYNAAFARHFRKADPPKPALDVEAVASAIYHALPDSNCQHAYPAIRDTLRAYFTDTPSENLKGSGVTITWDGITANGVKIADRMERGE